LQPNNYSSWKLNLLYVTIKKTHKEDIDKFANDETGNVSMEFGINCNSILNELYYFDVCPDIMHDVLEGTVLP